MFSSKFDCLAEIEALRAGLKPSAVRSIHSAPRLIPFSDRGEAKHPTRPTLAPGIERITADAMAKAEPVEPTIPDVEDSDIRAEMERRLAVRLADRRIA